MLRSVLFALFFVSLTFAKTYDCNTNSTVYLQSNEIAFFNMELTKLDDALCNLTFTFIGNNTDAWMYKVIENYTTNNIMENTFFETSNKSSYSITNDGSIKQGYVLFEDKNNGCPLESISPFAFTDESQILHVRSDYGTNVASTCNWNFTAPKDYGFKVVILYFDESLIYDFKLENKTDLIATNKGMHWWGRRFYIVGNWIKITLSKNISNSSNPFQMYVSVVKQKFNETYDNCERSENGNLKTWTNYKNYSISYGNNVRCNFTLHLRQNTEVQFYQKFYNLEENSDYIVLDIEGNEEQEKLKNYGFFAVNKEGTTLTYHYVENWIYRSKVFKINGPETNVYFEFVSDGSYQSSGFKIEFLENECRCADREIECSEFNEYGIITDQLGYYCNNMNCSFTILPCKTEFTLLNIERSYPELNGSFKVYTNNLVVYDMQNFIGWQTNAEVFLNSSNINEIKILTYSNSYLKHLTFTVKPVNNLPKPDLKIVLTPENPSYIIEDGKYNMVIVETSDAIKSQNFSFSLFQYNRGRSLPIFSDESLTYNLREEYCRYNDKITQCLIPRKKLVIFASHASISTPTAIQLSNNFGNCVFEKNIFNIDRYDNNYVSAISSEHHECSLPLIMGAYAFYYISEIWTSAKNENISVFFGTNVLYFDFNSNTASQWKNVGFFSKAYTLKMPKKTTVFIKFRQYDPFFNVLPSPTQSSVIATPYYGTWNKLSYNETFVEYDIGNEIVNFKIANFKTSNNFEFYFIVNGTKTYVNRSKLSYPFKNQRVGLHYIFLSSNQRDFDHGILFHMNVLHETSV